MSKSRKHHYVPQFMTRHFAKEDGQIFAYNKIDDIIFQSSGINLFVEKDRNTFPNLEGVADDVTERVYTSFDTLFGGILDEITKSNTVSDINYKMLLYLAYISKWRVPQYDDSFKIAKVFFSMDDLGLGLKNFLGEKIDLNLEDHFQLEMQQELKRLFLAVQPFRFKEDYKTILNNSFLICTPISSFIGDCPFNEATISDGKLFEDFVFPVTKDLTMVFSTRINRKEILDFLSNGDDSKVKLFLRDFSTSRDISMLHIAARNVACCDKEHLTNIVDNYKVFMAKGTGTAFNLTVFNVLYRFKEYL